MSPAEVVPLYVETEDPRIEVEGLRAALENERRRYADLVAQVERIGQAAMLGHGGTDCDVAQAGFDLIRALAAKACREAR